MCWYYQGGEFTSDDIGSWLGFVYVITDKENGKKYVGKKLFWNRKKLKPLKGKKRARYKVTESDWMKYYGSSEIVQKRLEEMGPDNFHREILHLCRSKGQLSYMELKEQMEREVLFSEEYYNNIIQVRIHGSHVKKVDEDG